MDALRISASYAAFSTTVIAALNRPAPGRTFRGGCQGQRRARNVNVTGYAVSFAPTFVIARTACVLAVNHDADISDETLWLSRPLSIVTATVTRPILFVARLVPT